LEARGFLHPPYDGVPLLAALLRKMRLLDLLSASRESHANIISESQCLEARLALSTELPTDDPEAQDKAKQLGPEL